MKLEAGDVICPQCHGTGHPDNNRVKEYELKYNIVPKVCDKCHGSGKFDWIEAVVGKRKTCTYMSPGVYINGVRI